MKNKIIILSILFGGIFTACDDFLKELPSYALPPEESITSIDDLELAVNGVLSYSVNREYYGGDFIAYADLKGSDCYSIATNNQISPIGRYTHDQYSSYVVGYYARGYQMLARINEILIHVPNLPAGTDRDELEGELYALRGLVHFDMARLFAKLPTVATDLNAANSGIPICDQVFPVDHKPVRATLSQTYNLILEDFTKSLTLLEATATPKTNGRIGYWSAKGLRARAYLYLGRNNDALADANDVITRSPYKLLERADYVGSWIREGVSETIFEILTTSLYNAQRNSIGYYCASAGYGEIAMRDEFREFINAIPGDVRAGIIVEEAGTYPGYYPKKHPGRSSLYENNLRVIRLNEVYLIAAEAAVKGGTASGAGSAADYINTLLSKRIEGYTNVTSVTLDNILDERRKELFSEGHMCWDMWRNGRTVNNHTRGVVANTDNLCILPFPQREIDLSSELMQNPGY